MWALFDGIRYLHVHVLHVLQVPVHQNVGYDSRVGTIWGRVLVIWDGMVVLAQCRKIDRELQVDVESKV